MIILKAFTLIIVNILVTIFACILADMLANTMHNKRIKKLTEVNKRLIKQNKRHINDYQSIYENMVRVNTMMRELKKENEELKKQLDKQRTVSYDITFNNIIECEVPNSDEAKPPLQKN